MSTATACPTLTCSCPTVLSVILTLVITLLVIGIVLLIIWCCCINAWISKRAAAEAREMHTTVRMQNTKAASQEKTWGFPIGFKDYINNNEIPMGKVRTVRLQKSSDDLGFHVLDEGGGMFISHIDDESRLKHLKHLHVGQHVIGMTILFEELNHKLMSNLIAYAAKNNSCYLYTRSDLTYELEGAKGELCKLGLGTEEMINAEQEKPKISSPKIKIVRDIQDGGPSRPELFENNYLHGRGLDIPLDAISIDISDDDYPAVVITLPEIKTMPASFKKADYQVPSSSPSPKPSLTRSTTFDDIEDEMIASRNADQNSVHSEIRASPYYDAPANLTPVIHDEEMVTVRATPISIPTADRISAPLPETMSEIEKIAAEQGPPVHNLEPQLQISSESLTPDNLSRQTSSGFFSLSTPDDIGREIPNLDHMVEEIDEDGEESEKDVEANEEEITAPSVHQLFAAPTMRYDTSNLGFKPFNETSTSFSEDTVDYRIGSAIQEEEEENEDSSEEVSTSFGHDHALRYDGDEGVSYLEGVPEEDEELGMYQSEVNKPDLIDIQMSPVNAKQIFHSPRSIDIMDPHDNLFPHGQKSVDVGDYPEAQISQSNSSVDLEAADINASHTVLEQDSPEEPVLESPEEEVGEIHNDGQDDFDNLFSPRNDGEKYQTDMYSNHAESEQYENDEFHRRMSTDDYDESDVNQGDRNLHYLEEDQIPDQHTPFDDDRFHANFEGEREYPEEDQLHDAYDNHTPVSDEREYSDDADYSYEEEYEGSYGEEEQYDNEPPFLERVTEEEEEESEASHSQDTALELNQQQRYIFDDNNVKSDYDTENEDISGPDEEPTNGITFSTFGKVSDNRETLCNGVINNQEPAFQSLIDFDDDQGNGECDA